MSARCFSRRSARPWIACSLMIAALAGCRSPSTPDANADDATTAPDVSAADRVTPTNDATMNPDTGVLPGMDASADAASADAASDDAAMMGMDADAGSVRADAAPYARPDTIDVPSLPDVSLEGLPRDDAGNVIGARSEEGQVVLVPGDAGPLQVLARCSSLVTRCVSPGVRTLDACMISAPVCTTATPWNEPPCCPAACATQYESLRRMGDAPVRAFDRALFGEPSCVAGIPGVGAM